MSSALRKIRRTRRRHRPARPPWWRVALPVAAVALALGSIAWSVVALIHAPFLAVRQIEILGAERLDPQQVREMLAPSQGQPLLTVSLASIESRLEALPALERAVIARRLPDLLEVRVIERVAVATVRSGSLTLLVDRHGVLFPRGRPLLEDERLPELRGLRTPLGAGELVEEDRAGLRALSALHRATGGEPLPAGTVLDLAPADRIELRLGPGAPVVWLDRAAPRTNLAALMSWRKTVARLAPGRAIDLRFRNRLTVLPLREDTARRN